MHSVISGRVFQCGCEIMQEFVMAKQCCSLLHSSCCSKLSLFTFRLFLNSKMYEVLGIFIRNVFCFIHMHKTRQPFINPVINKLLVDTTTLYMALYPTSCQFKPKQPVI